MVGDVVDGVWGDGGMIVEEELAVIPFVFKSALISPKIVETTFKSFCLC